MTPHLLTYIQKNKMDPKPIQGEGAESAEELTEQGLGTSSLPIFNVLKQLQCM